ncbi:hypothetical protein B0H21DRAFT_58781 [Amylocystis lapponica]|nr:hypothetical protein B0H21DRAFT_58781 [Amylocystis lapponica]
MSPPSCPPGHDRHNIYYLFPHIDQDVIASILHHTLSAAELYKLDSRRIFESQWNFVDPALEDSALALQVGDSAHDIYETLDSLVVPLNIYFSVLTLHGLANAQNAMLPCYFFAYTSQLVKIAAQYEWHAVLSYHLAFFARRCKEMRTGEYSGWGKINVDLMEEFLVPNQKNAMSRIRGRKK